MQILQKGIRGSNAGERAAASDTLGNIYCFDFGGNEWKQIKASLATSAYACVTVIRAMPKHHKSKTRRVLSRRC